MQAVAWKNYQSNESKTKGKNNKKAAFVVHRMMSWLQYCGAKSKHTAFGLRSCVIVLSGEYVLSRSVMPHNELLQVKKSGPLLF